jgi:hypothetical protein
MISEKRKAYLKAYQKSDKRKAYQKAYRKSDKFKAYLKAYQKSDKYKAYQKSDKRKAYLKAYQKSDKFKAYLKAYQKTDKYKAYRKTDKFKEKRSFKHLIKEYHYLLGKKEPTVREMRKLEAIADYLGREIDEWRNKKQKAEYQNLIQEAVL